MWRVKIGLDFLFEKIFTNIIEMFIWVFSTSPVVGKYGVIWKILRKLSECGSGNFIDFEVLILNFNFATFVASACISRSIHDFLSS